ncbi:hypothetical protein [Acidithiobacillus sp.]|uniref:hypothetical protein n=1 Tax=Acidithiobacillus sp. TaxID=1872118 RepID=UPI003D00CCA1
MMLKSPNSRLLKRSLLIAAALVLTGCAQGPVLRVQSVAQHSYPPSAVVETLTAAPSRPYVVIARIHGQAPAGTPGAQVLAAIERKAAALGADAVIVQDRSQQTAATLQFNAAGGNYQNTPAQITPIYDATAIRWAAASDAKNAAEQ